MLFLIANRFAACCRRCYIERASERTKVSRGPPPIANPHLASLTSPRAADIIPQKNNEVAVPIRSTLNCLAFGELSSLSPRPPRFSREVRKSIITDDLFEFHLTYMPAMNTYVHRRGNINRHGLICYRHSLYTHGSDKYLAFICRCPEPVRNRPCSVLAGNRRK